MTVPDAAAGGACAIIGDEMWWLHLSLRHEPATDRRMEAPQTEPMFASPELVDVRRPSSHERSELERISEHPPDIAGASARATGGLAGHEQRQQ
jgi:hypothetical protein